MAAAARAFQIGFAELMHELEARQELLEAEICRLRTRLRALPRDCHELQFLVQEMTGAGAVAAELESLCGLITGEERE